MSFPWVQWKLRLKKYRCSFPGWGWWGDRNFQFLLWSFVFVYISWATFSVVVFLFLNVFLLLEYLLSIIWYSQNFDYLAYLWCQGFLCGFQVLFWLRASKRKWIQCSQIRNDVGSNCMIKCNGFLRNPSKLCYQKWTACWQLLSTFLGNDHLMFVKYKKERRREHIYGSKYSGKGIFWFID